MIGRSLLTCGVGFAILVASPFVTAHWKVLGLALMLAGLAVSFVGFALLVRARGLHPAWNLLALLTLLGLLVVAVIPTGPRTLDPAIGGWGVDNLQPNRDYSYGWALALRIGLIVVGVATAIAFLYWVIRVFEIR